MSNRPEALLAGTLAAGAAVLAIATPALTGGYNATQPYFTRPSFFPWMALGLVVAFGAWSAWQAWRGVQRDLSDEIEAEHTSVRLALGGAALFLGYVVLCVAVGYTAATFVALTLFGWWVGLERRFAIILAGATTAVLYLVFVVGFKVWFAPSWIALLWQSWN